MARLSRPTGEQFELVDSDQRAVVTEVGATLREYTVGGDHVIDGFGEGEIASGGRGQVLAPWPNRLEGGSYSYGGLNCLAALDDPQSNGAIHGLVRWVPWTLVTRSAASVTLETMLYPQPAYLWCVRLEVSYALSSMGLVVEAEVTNLGNGAAGAPAGPIAPVGLGFHPYLSANGAKVDSLRLCIPAGRVLRMDRRGIPIGAGELTEDGVVQPGVAQPEVAGEGGPADPGASLDFRVERQLGAAVLDTCFCGLIRDHDGMARAWIDNVEAGFRTTLWVGPGFEYLMCYTGDTLAEPLRRRRGIAIEPMTCPPNALRSGESLVPLAFGSSFRTTWGIRYEKVPIKGNET